MCFYFASFCNECETWSYTLREKRSLRVFENGVLRRVFGLKRDEVTGEWRTLLRWSGYVAHMGARRVAYRF
jgi:hypothetical protein